MSRAGRMKGANCADFAENAGAHRTASPHLACFARAVNVRRPMRSHAQGLFRAGVPTMSTFYLLPPRPILGDRLAGFLRSVLPGLDWDMDTCSNLAEAVAAAASVHADVFVVYREDLPEG